MASRRDQAVTLNLAADGLSTPWIDSLTITQRVNLPPTVVVRIRYTGKLAAALGTVAQPIQVKVFSDRQYRVAFTGIVTDASIGRSELLLTASGLSAARDEVFRVRSFGTGPERVAVKQLPGIAPLLQGVGNAAKFTMKVAHLYQYGQTDGDLLRLLAGWHKLHLLEDAQGKLALSDGSDGTPQLIRERDLAPGSETITLRKRSATARCVSADLLVAKTPDRPARASKSATPKTLLAAVAYKLGKGTPHDICGGGLGLTDAERAARAEASARALAVTWSGLLVGPAAARVRVGDRLKLKGSPITDELRVQAAELTYSVGTQQPLTLAVECVPCDLPAAGVMALVPGPLVSAFGVTTNATDPNGRGWIQVGFPWHEPGDGMWCPVTQSFGAKPGQGAAEVPAKGDTVLAIFDPSSFDPPCVLGSVYRGPGGAATKSTRRILFNVNGVRAEVDTESGLLILAGKTIKLLGAVTISETLDVKKGGQS